MQRLVVHVETRQNDSVPRANQPRTLFQSQNVGTLLIFNDFEVPAEDVYLGRAARGRRTIGTSLRGMRAETNGGNPRCERLMSESGRAAEYPSI